MSYHREASQEEAAFASMMSQASPRETAKPPMMMSQSGKLVSNLFPHIRDLEELALDLEDRSRSSLVFGLIDEVGPAAAI